MAEPSLIATEKPDPDVPQVRWLIEIHPDHQKNTGPFEDIGAPHLDIDHGTLIFRDDLGKTVFVRAAGTWLTVCPSID